MPAKVLGETALLCRVAGRLLADDPALARFEGLGAAQARLGEALTRSLDPHARGAGRGRRPAVPRRARPSRSRCSATSTPATGPWPASCSTSTTPATTTSATSPTRSTGSSCRGCAGLAEGCASPDVPAGSVLERGADLLHGDLTDAYALTHAVLHATDCGLLAPRTDRPASSVADDAEALLGAALACGNLDVAAELLWTWPMLGLPLSPGARYALAELDRAEATHGFLPGPEHDPAVAAASLSPADRSTYVIQTSYHTAVAGAVLAAALLRAADADRAPAGARPASARRAAPTPDADPLPLLVHADGPWAAALRRRPLADRVACTELVVGAELRTAAARRDPAQVHDVVAWAAEHGWAHLPSVRQGAALLRGWPGSRPSRSASPADAGPGAGVRTARGGRRRSGPAG